MSQHAPISVLSSRDPSILDLFADIWTADITTGATIQVVTAIAQKVIQAFLDSESLPTSTQVTLIPALRAALPMYVAAVPAFPTSNTALVQCSRDRSLSGTRSVTVKWMGTNPVEAARQSPAPAQRRMIILDTVIGSGATVLKLCDELSKIGGLQRQVTVLCCYASPPGLAAVAAHPAVHSVFVAHRSDRLDEHGWLVPYTHGDIGDKLFGPKGELEVLN